MRAHVSNREGTQVSSSYSLILCYLQPHSHLLSEWNNPTQPPPRGGVPNGSESEKVSLIQRGRFFTSKRRPFHGKETPSSIERRRFFHFKILLPLYLSGIGVHVNDTIHAPLHSERGRGRGCRGAGVRLLRSCK